MTVCLEVTGQPWVSPWLLLCLRQAFLFVTAFTRLAGPQAPVDSVSPSNFALEKLGLQICKTVSGFTWVLGIWTKVPTFVEKGFAHWAISQCAIVFDTGPYYVALASQ